MVFHYVLMIVHNVMVIFYYVKMVLHPPRYDSISLRYDNALSIYGAGADLEFFPRGGGSGRRKMRKRSLKFFLEQTYVDNVHVNVITLLTHICTKRKTQLFPFFFSFL